MCRKSQQITTDGVNLCWHTKPNDDGCIPQPLHVQVHVHISDCIGGEGDKVEPNLTWSSTNSLKNEEELEEKHILDKQRCSLFDVASIHKATTNSSRIIQTYPTISDPENCVTIILNDKSILLFEASNVTEAKKVVHGFWWIVVRLSFNLIMGNRDVCAELLPVPRRKKTVSKQNNMMFNSEIMNDVTNQLVEKSLELLKHYGVLDDKRLI